MKPPIYFAGKTNAAVEPGTSSNAVQRSTGRSINHRARSKRSLFGEPVEPLVSNVHSVCLTYAKFQGALDSNNILGNTPVNQQAQQQNNCGRSKGKVIYFRPCIFGYSFCFNVCAMNKFKTSSNIHQPLGILIERLCCG